MEATDKILCRGLEVECGIGFRDFEKRVLQTLAIDFEVTFSAAEAMRRDDPDFLPLDYSAAVFEISRFLKGKRYNLIETVGGDVAELLLERFRIRSVEVTVTKRPRDLSGIEVSFVCRRHRPL